MNVTAADTQNTFGPNVANSIPPSMSPMTLATAPRLPAIP